MKSDLVVISYDIEDDKKRKKISDALMDAGGLRVQKSVFECSLNKTQFTKLHKNLSKLREKGDSIRYYFICDRCRGRIILDEETQLHLELKDEKVQVV